MKHILLVVFLGIYLILSLLFLSRYALVGQAVYGDGIFYWAYTRSLVINRDLDLRNEGSHTYGPYTNNTHSTDRFSNETDLTMNKYYPIGVSLLWLPSFIVAHGIAWLINQTGNHIPSNGYADLYQLLVGLWNVGLATGGLFLVCRLLSHFYAKKIALITCFTLLFGTNLLYYSGIDVINTHPTALFLSSLFVYSWVTTIEKRTRRMYFILGGILGLMTMVRPQDALYGLVFLIEFCSVLYQKPKVTTISSPKASSLFALCIGFLLGFLPQLLTSKIIYETFLLIPYARGSNLFDLSSVKLIEIIFDSQRGLLYYSPLFLISFAGLFLLGKKERVVQLSAIAVIFSEYFLVSMWSGWSQGEAFGMRMFISLIPLLSFGLAKLITVLLRYVSLKTLLVIILFFIIQNGIMIVVFHLFLHNPTVIDGELSQSGQLREEILKQISETLAIIKERFKL